ncbi:MAG TPA: hypothetical protein VKY73_00385 [Polyangiaceae bacterium]|nr:hypothetical protein [Polyangiaceae bacterium]
MVTGFRKDVRNLGWLLGFLALGCNVESTGKDTGGVPKGTSSECPDGLVVLMSDYLSTQIALSELDGETQSESFLSTGSTETDGLAFPLSGDVALPGTRPESGLVVLLDRFGTNVVSWVDPETAEVLAQLSVATGFESNPSDYLEIDERTALLSRWGQNAEPGREDHDTGGDVLILDTEEPAITGSIELDVIDDLPPRPSALTRVGDEVWVTLDRVALDYSTTGEAMVVGISIEDLEVVWQERIDGLKACGRLATSPDGTRLALACTGELDETGGAEDLDQSALVLFDATASPPKEIQRIPAADITGEPLQSDVVFARDDLVLLNTQSAWGGDTNNRWLALDLETGETEELLEASPDADGAGKGGVYGAMVCAPGCSDTCLLADADRGVLARVRVPESGMPEAIDPITVETRVGLPPRDLALR